MLKCRISWGEQGAASTVSEDMETTDDNSSGCNQTELRTDGATLP
jgi:hypothetical protein